MKKQLLLSIASISLLLCGCSTKTTKTNITTDTTTESAFITDINISNTFEESTNQQDIPTYPFERNASYEKDCVFLGDSVCMGLKVYKGLLKSTQVYAQGNIGARSLLDSNQYTFLINGKKYSAVEAVKARQPKYIYLWMGMNDINISSKEKYAEDLKKIIDTLSDVSPYSKFVVMSITPLSEDNKWNKDPEKTGNIKIVTYNTYVENFINKLNNDDISYLNVYDLLADGNGFLPLEYYGKGGDGLHLDPMAYDKILRYVSQNRLTDNDDDFPVSTTEFPYYTTTTSTQSSTHTTHESPSESTETISSTLEDPTSDTSETTSNTSQKPIESEQSSTNETESTATIDYPQTETTPKSDVSTSANTSESH